MSRQTASRTCTRSFSPHSPHAFHSHSRAILLPVVEWCGDCHSPFAIVVVTVFPISWSRVAKYRICCRCLSNSWYSGSEDNASQVITVWVYTSPSPCHRGDCMVCRIASPKCANASVVIWVMSVIYRKSSLMAFVILFGMMGRSSQCDCDSSTVCRKEARTYFIRSTTSPFSSTLM